MRILSVSEFAEFCKKKNPTCFIYATTNQCGNIGNRMNLVLCFSEMITCLKPDRICFKNKYDQLSVEMVSFVKVYDEKPCVGTVFEIHSDAKRTDSVSTWLMD